MAFVDSIRCLLVKRGNISQAELARRLGETPQNISKKLGRNSIRERDLRQISAAVGCSCEIVFTDTQTGKTVYREKI